MDTYENTIPGNEQHAESAPTQQAPQPQQPQYQTQPVYTSAYTGSPYAYPPRVTLRTRISGRGLLIILTSGLCIRHQHLPANLHSRRIKAASGKPCGFPRL